MLNLFQRYKTIENIGSILQMDMHAHWLPGIDDGAADMNTSIKMLQEYVNLGFEKVIATPHIYHDYYPNTKDTIKNAFNEVKFEAEKQNIPLHLDFAAEYYIDDHFETLLERKELLTFGENMVLVEQSFFSEHPDIHRVFFDMQIKGYQPIFAHVERYGFYANQMAALENIKASGILFQLNLASITGRYGKEVQKQAEFLIKKGMIDFFATDAHKIKDLKDLSSMKTKNDFLLKNQMV